MISDSLNSLRDSQESITAERWFIGKRADTGICEIVKGNSQEDLTDFVETWGAFNSQGEAIAKRVGLIRAGKCQPL
ncbi:DDE transposase family protein [Pseudanabaena sp. ABRG5-3]|uniref:DDE transposase family protein n=1 Tax=Pseudanabaena sp. ABRG5-3 TaxID=685565 RepID=UPI000DC6E9F2|nr:DDE transposase family protein [Pseudanabaena sp. ABRG5-3]BBC25207.1 hypothetical protein ABRG53_2950 [Pseudanabaena sp. ABRG5-3]